MSPFSMRQSPFTRALAALVLFAACAATACGNDDKNNGHASGGGGAGGSSNGGKTSDAGKAGNDVAGGSNGGAHAGNGGNATAGQGGKAGSGAGGGNAGTNAEGGAGAGGADSTGDGGVGIGGGNEGGAGGVQVECGNGIKEAGEECEPANTSTCTERCQIVSTKACVDCESAGACINYSTICFDNFVSEDERSICYEVLKCVRDTNCADGADTQQHCFCGTLNTGQCQAAPSVGAGAPNGACTAIIREAMSQAGQEATSAQVLEHLIDESLPGGAALARVNCDRQDPACIGTCGY